MAQFINELKRRNVIRVGIAYLAVAWLLVQVAETLLPVYGFPDSVIRSIVTILAIGFVISVALSWTFEWTPKGIFKDADSEPKTDLDAAKTRTIDRFIILSLVIAVAYFAIDKFVLDPDRDAQIAQVAADRARVDALADTDRAKSIAVLPFVNRSNRDDDVYFVDGIHDDILTQLAKINAVSVTSRTSVEQFRNTELPIRDVASMLNVQTVLEGGVQRLGNRVRINVQLIDAINDDHLWAETYERDLTVEDLFAVQADIATRVAEELRATLVQEVQRSLHAIPTDNFEAYDLYLLGRHRLNQRTKASVDSSIPYFEQAIDQDPGFVAAMAGLAVGYLFQVDYGTAPGESAFPLADAVLQDALALDDSSSVVWSAIGRLRTMRNDPDNAEVALRRAIELDNNNFDAWYWYAALLFEQRQYEESFAASQNAYDLDPASMNVNNYLAYFYWLKGDFVNASRHWERADEMATDQSRNNWANRMRSYFWSGRLARIIEVSRQEQNRAPNSLAPITWQTTAYLTLGDAASAQLWSDRAEAMAVRHQGGFRIPKLSKDFGAVIAYLENTLELQNPERNLWLIYELFEAHFFFGDLDTARRYLDEYIAEQQGQIELDPVDFYQMENLVIAAFWIHHGAAETNERERGLSLAEEIRDNMKSLVDGDWRHPLTLASLAGAWALLGDNASAINRLNEAIDRGYRNQDNNLGNITFDGIRDLGEFSTALERIETLVGEERSALAATTLAEYQAPLQRETVTVTRDILERYAGLYSSGETLFRFYVDDDGVLHGRWGVEQTNRYYAVSENEFVSPSDQFFTVRFESENDQVTHFLLEGNFGEMLFKSIDDRPPAISLARGQLERFAGVFTRNVGEQQFQSDLSTAEVVVADDDRIWLNLADRPRVEIYAAADRTFYLIGFDGRIEFEVNPITTEIDQFLLFQDGIERRFYRQ